MAAVARLSGESPTQPNVDNAVLTAVVDSYYPDVARAGTTARARAQAAQSVATIFATALAGGLTLTAIRQQPLFVRILSCLAVLCWAAAAILYMRTVGTAVRIDEHTSGVNDADRLVRVVLERAKIERDSIDRRQWWANLASMVSLALTAAVFMGTSLAPNPEPIKAAILSTTESQMNLLPGQCNANGTRILGQVHEESLRTDTVKFSVKCGNATVLMIVPKSNIKGMVILEQ